MLNVPVKKNILDMSPYTVPQEFDGAKLNQNESPFDIPAGIKEKIFDRLKDIQWNRYPAGEPRDLTKSLSNYTRMPEDNIIVSSSSNELILTLLIACCNSGDPITIVSPTFSVYPRAARAMNIAVDAVPLKKDFEFDTQRIVDSAKKSRLVILASPNNPTGTVISLEAVEEIAASTNALVVIDEAYYEFYEKSAQVLIEKFPNLAVLRTFSKALQSAGIRLGYLLAQETIISQLKKVKLPFSVGFFQQAAGEIILENFYLYAPNIKQIKAERSRVFQQMHQINGIEPIPSQANFILFRTTAIPSGTLYNILRENGILVRAYDSPDLSGMLRVSIGTPKENDTFLDTLAFINKRDINHEGHEEKKTFLFDMDGVLVDVSESYRMAIKLTAEYFLGEKIALGDIQVYKDRGGLNNDWDLTEAILKDNGLAIEKQKIIDVFQEFYLGTGFSGLIVKEKWLASPSTLDLLAGEFKLGIVTGRPREEALFTLNRFNMERYFQTVVTMDDIPADKGKPDPLGLRKAMVQLNAKEGYYAGDTIDDMIAAKKAGLIPLGVIARSADKVQQETRLKESGAVFTYNGISELTASIVSSCWCFAGM